MVSSNFARRPAARHNRNRIAADGPGYDPLFPLTLLGPSRLRVWYSADVDALGANNSNIATLTDISGNGNHATAFAGGAGAIVGADGWDGRTTIVQRDKAFVITGASAVAVFNGSQKPFTCIMAKQDRDTTSAYVWAAGVAVATNQYQLVWNASNAKQQVSTALTAAAVNDNQLDQICCAPKIEIWMRNASDQWTLRRDGIQENAFTRASTGAVCDLIMIGGSANGTGAAAICDQVWRHYMLIEGTITNAERTQLELWLAADNGLLWKKGFGVPQWSGNTYVVVGMGQSNMVGAGTAPFVANNDSRALNMDRHVCLVPMADPASELLGGYNTFYYAGVLTSLSGSCWPSVCNQLLANTPFGANDRLLICNNSSSASKADDWKLSSATTPPPINRLIGATKINLLDIIRNAPNVVFLGAVIWQGESDSDNATEAAEWGTVNWGPLCNDFLTWATTNGVTWKHATNRFVVVRLPVTGWTSGPFWADVRTSQTNLVGARADSVLVDATNGPWTAADTLHLEMAPLASTGVAIGTALGTFW